MKARIRLIVAAILACTLAGCINMPKQSLLNRISVGMNKAEVIQTLGEPNSSAAQGNTEYFKYLMDNWPLAPKPCFVRFIDGKVESYGNLGDFDSTKDPTIRVKFKAE